MSEQKTGVPEEDGIRFEEIVVVDRPARELYDFWRDFGNLPKFMTVLDSVELLEGGVSRWHIDGPLGKKISWDAEVVNEEPAKFISWQTIGDPLVGSAGTVRFTALNEQQTQVKINAQYYPPGGEVGMALVALFLDDPERRIKDDLGRFKAYMENSSNTIHGEV